MSTSAKWFAPSTSLLARAAGLLPLSLGARLASIPAIRGPIRSLINSVVPARRHVRVRVMSGPARGAALVLNLREEKALWAGRVEPLVEGVFADLVGPGCTVYDIGAHIGYFSLIASRLAGESGSVIAFEPDEQNAARLERHALINAAANLRVIRAAVADTSRRAHLLSGLGSRMSRLVTDDYPAGGAGGGNEVGKREAAQPPAAQLPDLCRSELRLLEAELKLFATRGVAPGDLSDQISGAAQAVERGEWQDAWRRIGAGRDAARMRLSVLHEIHEIDAITLDDFVFSLGNPPPDVIKMDVEGAEALVIRGAGRLLEEAAPTILCEMHGADAAREVIESLMTHGYELYEVEAGLRPVAAVLLPIRPGGTHILAKRPARDEWPVPAAPLSDTQ